MSQVIMSSHKRKLCELDAETIAYFRRNPVEAARLLLNVPLLDSQAYILTSSWNASQSVWCCSRNFGKSFLGAVFMLLKAMLYEDQNIIICSSVGQQAKQTMQKIEEIVTRTGQAYASIKSNEVNDIAERETVKSPTNRTGFSHDVSSHSVHFYNGSSISTINSKPSNARSRRATLVFFDEAAFCDPELIVICEAFAMQNTDFVTSVDENYNPETEPRRVPTQIVYASSQDGRDTMFYHKYKDYAKRMLAGDRNYFVCDMICDTAITTYIKGKPYKPLLTREKVEVAMVANRDKALREKRSSSACLVISMYLPLNCWQSLKLKHYSVTMKDA